MTTATAAEVLLLRLEADAAAARNAALLQHIAQLTQQQQQQRQLMHTATVSHVDVAVQTATTPSPRQGDDGHESCAHTNSSRHSDSTSSSSSICGNKVAVANDELSRRAARDMRAAVVDLDDVLYVIADMRARLHEDDDDNSTYSTTADNDTAATATATLYNNDVAATADEVDTTSVDVSARNDIVALLMHKHKDDAAATATATSSPPLPLLPSSTPLPVCVLARRCLQRAQELQAVWQTRCHAQAQRVAELQRVLCAQRVTAEAQHVTAQRRLHELTRQCDAHAQHIATLTRERDAAVRASDDAVNALTQLRRTHATVTRDRDEAVAQLQTLRQEHARVLLERDTCTATLHALCGGEAEATSRARRGEADMIV